MNTTVDNILCSLVASIIYDVGKYILGQLRYQEINIEKEDVEKYITRKLNPRYNELCESGIFGEYIKSPLVLDTINNYIIYVITGNLEKKLMSEGVMKKGRSKYLRETDIIGYLAINLQKEYQITGTIGIPNYSLLTSFFKDIFVLGSEYVFSKMDQEKAAVIYFINNRMNLLGDGIFSKLDEIITILNKSIQLDIICLNEEYRDDKEYYITILRNNHKMAHIYLLDKFDIDEFYVPPFLSQRDGRRYGLTIEYQNRIIYKSEIDSNDANNVRSNDWKYVFDKSNIIYIIGGLVMENHCL
jgi:hypothetical protein